MRGHVRKRGSKWCYVIDVGRDPQTGKRKQKWSKGFPTKREAERELNKTINEIENGTFVESNKMTLGEYLEIWLQDYAKNAVKPTTLESYSYLIKTHIVPFLGPLSLDKLQAIHVQRFYNKMLEEGRIKSEGGLSSGTVRRLHGLLNTALNQAVKWRLVNLNVVTLVESPKHRKKEISPLNLEEVKRFLFYAKNDRYYITFLLAITTGLRRGEILGLRWKDVDMNTCTASIRKNLVLVSHTPVLQEPKTRRSVRSVTLPPIVIQALKNHKQVQDQEKTNELYQCYDLITATCFGSPLNPLHLRKRFKKILTKANLPDIRFHDLRHTHATLMLQQGEHPKVVSERLGHSNINITLDTYSHVLPNMQQEAVERFEKMLLHDEENNDS
ncbi:site-specific integrase [Thermoactinomyces sp. DSM 45892]|uniref:site-specific integrase n=1 Tax=Thermoactinomyces sp. DSM 45892 TaxID=1882753 RepID=UPI00089D9D0A|nr:site-specific integrase [Thermoactinomyces sp. DSM 45892]SDY56923.1 Site-specific recombinase XerD [Thermoactinomyces sp. DSM 45892]